MVAMMIAGEEGLDAQAIGELDGIAVADGDEDIAHVLMPGSFIVDIEGFEGPIDVLLTLARNQKVDLVHISIVQLADQYLKFVTEARRANLDLAADYLVMAAWLAYLKSRLLLPDDSTDEEPTGEELAAALQFQLKRLEAMQNAGAQLMERPRLGVDFFARGEREKFSHKINTIWDADLNDLLKAYGAQQSRAQTGQTLRVEQSWELHSVEDALARLKTVMGDLPDWESLVKFLPEDLAAGLPTRSALAATFAASLELAKQGRLLLRQESTFGAIFLRSREPDPDMDMDEETDNDNDANEGEDGDDIAPDQPSEEWN